MDQDGVDRRRERFARLHADGSFVMPNAWDIGSARLLENLGFSAIATTSSGHAATLGRRDQRVTRDELLAHAAALASAVEVPVSVDSEQCFPDDPGGVAVTVRRVAETGAAGCSIEDYDPAAERIDPVDLASERVAAAVDEARRQGLVVTARAENHLYGIEDLDDTVSRLCSYRDAGAHVVYAPGLTSVKDISHVVAEVGAPVNVLALPHGPSVGVLSSLGVRRISTGGSLAFAAYGALVSAAEELATSGTSTYAGGALGHDAREAAFTDDP